MGKFVRYIFYGVLFVFHSILRPFIHKKSIEKKYNVSICAIFKDEALYLREWIEFHKIIGVDHFYLYNNNSSDNYLDVLKPYIDAGVVTLIEYPGKQMQLKCFKECIVNYSNETKWLGFIDIDEYVVPIKDNNIYSFLKKFERNTGAVKIYWRVFGTSGYINRDTKRLVTEDFTVCYPYYTNLGKCFYNTAFEVNVNLPRNDSLYHHFYAKLGKLYVPPVNSYGFMCAGTINLKLKNPPIQINHYFTKSYEEYENKMKRGDAVKEVSPKNISYFYAHEEQCTSVDYSAYKYLIKLKKSMEG